MPPTLGGKSLVTRRWRLMGATSACQPAWWVKRSVGTRPARSSMRMARASSASMTTASSGSRPRRKLTTQSSHAVVSRNVQQSQSMVSPPSDSVLVEVVLVEVVLVEVDLLEVVLLEVELLGVVLLAVVM